MSSTFRYYTKWLILIFLILIANAPGIYGQDNVPQPIRTVGLLTEQYWSADSRYFTYAYDGWRRYDLLTSKWTSSTTWPLTLPLSADESAAFAPVKNPYVSAEGLIFESPNQRFLAYPTTAGLPGNSVFAVADRQTLKHHILENLSVDYPYDLDGFNVIWKNDSTAFLTTIEGPEGGVKGYTYVNNFATDVSSSIAIDADTAIGNNFYVQQAYDLGATNGSVLLLVAINDPSQPFLTTSRMEWRILIWSPSNTADNNLIETIDGKQILAASFAPGDDTKLLVLTRSNLFEYDVQTDAKIDHDLSFDVSITDSALFSPNGEQLILTQSVQQTAKTYLVRLFPNQTPTAEP